MNTGYSTHGHWTPLTELKEIEVKDRGNLWFNDTNLDLNHMEGIWITKDPKKAISYLFTSDEFESEEYRETLKHPQKYLFKVDLTGAIPVLEDGDGGILFIRKREEEGENLEQQKGNDIKQIIEALAEKIISLIHENDDDPLDGDETDRIGTLLTLELDLRQGNITPEEHEKRLRRIEKA
jgi:hypothetical protein